MPHESAAEDGLSRWSIAVIIIVAVLVLLLWHLPILNILFYPIKIFVTFVHESSHGLAAILTGGAWWSFTVSANGEGETIISGGFDPIITSAGYLGSSAFGALMLIAATKRGWSQTVLFLIGLLLCLITLLFARNLFGFVSGLLLSVAFIGIARISRGRVSSVLLAFLAVLNCIYSLQDLKVLILLAIDPRYAGSTTVTDAHIMSWEVSGSLIPPVFWAVIWMLISLAILTKTLVYIFRRPEKIATNRL